MDVGAGSADFPFVTLIVAMRNEERHIGATLGALAAQDYPRDHLEVLVVDSNSTDRSAMLAGEACADHRTWRVLANPKRITAAAWNVGIENATGSIIGIVSGHCRLAPDYVTEAVDTLTRTGADLVGGPMVAVGESLFGRAVALATSAPFGVGDAQFHYLRVEAKVDTVFQGVSHRALFERIGPFDESLHCNEDDDLSFRILQAGGTIICNPTIRSEYTCRGSVRGLWSQYFRYGFWKVRLLSKLRRQMRWRHFVPAVFVSTIAFSAAASAVWAPARVLWIATLTLYGLCASVATAALLARRRDSALLVVPIVFLVMHLGYGTGFIGGLAQLRNRGNRTSSGSEPQGR